MKTRYLKAFLAQGVATLVLTAATSAGAQDRFPSRPVRIVVPASPGGTLDITARLYAQKMGEALGQPVIVDNRVGAETLLGTRAVKDAPADGYTLLAQANGFTLFPLLRSDAGYNALQDFTAVGILLRAPKLMVVSTALPYRNVAEFVAAAKKGKLTYASGGVGTPSHLAAAQFAQQFGLDLSNVPYKGTGAALPDVAAGRVDTLFDAYPSSLPYIQAGKLRPLGFTSATRVAAMLDVPTFRDQGFNYTNELWLGLVVRSGTPKNVVQRLSAAMHHASNSKDLRERFLREGADPSYMSPDEFSDFLANDAAQTNKLVTDLKLSRQ